MSTSEEKGEERGGQSGSEVTGDSEFLAAFAKAAGDIHRTLLDGKHDFTLRDFQPAEYYLNRLVELGVVSESESERIGEMIGGVQDADVSLEDLKLQDIKNELRDDPEASPVAVAIAGVVADSGSSAELRSVAGADAFGALVGGVAGAVAGEMVGGTTGAVAGGCFGAVLIGVVASWQEGHHEG